ncbi:uncharacterized [Tachysurus ichikawai]
MTVSPHAVRGEEYQGSPLPRRSQAALCDPDEMRMKEGVKPVTCSMKAVSLVQMAGDGVGCMNQETGVSSRLLPREDENRGAQNMHSHPEA